MQPRSWQELVQEQVDADPELAALVSASSPTTAAPTCAAFIHDLVIIDDAQPGDGELATMPFHLWPAQEELLKEIEVELLFLILKARQLGISWLVLAYALWLCLYHPGRLALVFSIGQAEANEMLRRVHVMYWRLPADVRATLPKLLKDNTEEMAWDNGSRVLSLPARKNAGSGYTASLVILDEFAKNQWAREIYTAVKPTIDGGGKMIILSSAYGAGNLFHEMVEKARASLGRFAFAFLPWTARPGRDAAWYAGVAADAVDESHMKQEYPATAEEAFEATEVGAFLSSITLWDACNGDIAPLDGHMPCVLALDAAESNDTFATGLVSARDAQTLEVRYAHAYVPEPKQKLDFNEIEIDVRELGQRHAIRELAYDPFLLGQFVGRLQKPATLYRTDDTEKAFPLAFPAFPAPCVPFHQGVQRLIADKALHDRIGTRTIVHDGKNEELRQHIKNANKKVDAEGRKLRIIKRVYAQKIDLAVMLSMACARAAEVLDVPRGADLLGWV